MIFKQALQRELSRTFTATLVVLVTIVMTMMLIRTLGLASKGSVNPQEVFLVMAYSVMGHIPTILTLSLFISLISALGRMTRDSEMVIWLTSGQSLMHFVRPLVTFSASILVAIAVLALFVWPWTNAQMQDLRERFEKRGDLERVIPGQFQESANGGRVFYVDKTAADAAGNSKESSLIQGAKHIFIASYENGRESITSAQNGKIEIVNGDPFLLLESGQRFERDLALGDIKLTQFQTMGSRVSADHINLDTIAPKSISSLGLIQEPTAPHLGELAWRLGLLFAAANLILIALVLSNRNARTARGGNMMMALLIFIFYYNMMNVCQVWIADGRVGFGTSLLLLHGGIFAIASLIFWRKMKS